MKKTNKTRSTQHLGEVKDLAQFLATINGAMYGSTELLFRGHRNAAWPLKPGIARLKYKVKPDEERAMLDEFRRRAIPYLESTYDLSHTDWLAIAQHHGMPTRLLDWSGSALTALWFAINEPAGGGVSGAVWMLPYEREDLMTNAERESPFDSLRTSLLRPRHVSRRITAQDGWFTLHRSHPSDDEESVQFVSLETNVDFMERLRYVTIAPAAFGPMRIELARAGVTSAVLFPDLQGVAAYVTRSHLFHDDEFLPRLLSPT